VHVEINLIKIIVRLYENKLIYMIIIGGEKSFLRFSLSLSRFLYALSFS